MIDPQVGMRVVVKVKHPFHRILGAFGTVNQFEWGLAEPGSPDTRKLANFPEFKPKNECDVWVAMDCKKGWTILFRHSDLDQLFLYEFSKVFDE